MLLDDVLSALDNTTESLIVERLLGPDGILRKLGTTVVLATHASKFARLQESARFGGLLCCNLILTR
jgi:ATP-binding cassette subfamily C (CFTR/MRP) protein 1